FIMGNGAYHIPLTTTTGEAQYARGIFSEEAYTYFKNVPIGTEEVYQYHFCGTSNDYDVQAGETCLSVGGNHYSHQFTINKVGHLHLQSTNALQEIFVDSDGNPSI